jgi:hypothetical protein
LNEWKKKRIRENKGENEIKTDKGKTGEGN